MEDVTKMMSLPVKFETRCTTSWMGKRDAEGRPIDERSYAARAYVFGHKVASSPYEVWYKTEKAAINACAELVRHSVREERKYLEEMA